MFAKLTLNLTKIGKLMRENPSLVFQKKNGDKVITVAVNSRKNGPDQYGNDLNVTLKPKDEPFDNKWYVGDGKEFKDAMQKPQDGTLAQAMQQDNSDKEEFPF